ncbi:hypothetical protein ACLEPN_40950 [Myxococcus sp. 1LA]
MLKFLGFKPSVTNIKPPPVPDIKPGAVGLEALDRTMNAVQLEATVAKSVGNKGGTTEPVKTPQQVLSTVGSTAGTANNVINVLDTFESGARTVGQMSKGTVPTTVPPSLVGKTVGKLVPGLNVVNAVASASNTADVFSNPQSTTAQKTHAVIDTTTAFVSALPVPGLAQGAAIVNTVNSLLTPSSPPQTQSTTN